MQKKSIKKKSLYSTKLEPRVTFFFENTIYAASMATIDIPLVRSTYKERIRGHVDKIKDRFGRVASFYREHSVFKKGKMERQNAIYSLANSFPDCISLITEGVLEISKLTETLQDCNFVANPDFDDVGDNGCENAAYLHGNTELSADGIERMMKYFCDWYITSKKRTWRRMIAKRDSALGLFKRMTDSINELGAGSLKYIASAEFADKLTQRDSIITISNNHLKGTNKQRRDFWRENGVGEEAMLQFSDSESDGVEIISVIDHSAGVAAATTSATKKKPKRRQEEEDDDEEDDRSLDSDELDDEDDDDDDDDDNDDDDDDEGDDDGSAGDETERREKKKKRDGDDIESGTSSDAELSLPENFTMPEGAVFGQRTLRKRRYAICDPRLLAQRTKELNGDMDDDDDDDDMDEDETNSTTWKRSRTQDGDASRDEESSSEDDGKEDEIENYDDDDEDDDGGDDQANDVEEIDDSALELEEALAAIQNQAEEEAANGIDLTLKSQDDENGVDADDDAF